MSSLLMSMPGAIAYGIIWGIMAIGVFITFRVLDVADLTVDGSMATGGIVLAVLAKNGFNIYLAVIIAFAVGCLAGFVTGIFHTFFGIPAILAGILTQLSLYSINLRISSKSPNVPVNANNIKNIMITSGNNTKSIIVGLIFAAVLIALLYWFFGTEFGSSVRATGNNQAMARANGINTRFNVIFGLVLSNGIVALSGALYAQYQGFADINMGRGAIVIGLAAVIVGEVVFGKIFRNFALTLVSVVIGGIIYYIVQNIVVWMGLDANDLKLLSAVIVALFLGLPHWREKFAAKKVKNKEVENNA
ncbi:MAG: ABC transporter permease [Eubacterium sp.]|nr:ABC transporter permease [Eubacterium sp.]MBR7060901.1 ABC transporter permease [Eubacterium sp.]